MPPGLTLTRTQIPTTPAQEGNKGVCRRAGWAGVGPGPPEDEPWPGATVLGPQKGCGRGPAAPRLEPQSPLRYNRDASSGPARGLEEHERDPSPGPAVLKTLPFIPWERPDGDLHPGAQEGLGRARVSLHPIPPLELRVGRARQQWGVCSEALGLP